MSDISLIITGATHQLYGAGLGLLGTLGRWRGSGTDGDGERRDRGAVSLEQVLWFVAAGVSVAVIASILWSQIRDKADDPVTPPAAP